MTTLAPPRPPPPSLVPPPPVPLDTVREEICSLAGQIAAATGRFLGLLADFDTREGWSGPGVRSCAHWLSWRCGMDLRTAREHVRVARALVVLPRTTAELGQGRLSYSKVRALARVATPENEDELVDIALAAPAAHVERLVRGLRAVADRDDRESGTDAERAEEVARRCRTQWRWDDATGELVIWGRFRPQDGVLLLAALTRAEHERTRTTTADGPAEPPDLTGPPPSDAGPALVAMAEITCAAVDAPAGSIATEVLVHRTAEGTRVAGGPHLADSAAEELECGAVHREVVVQDGCVLSYGRARRAPSAAQLRALHLRDQGCRAPGCGRTRFLHAHHVRPWSRGGTTDLDNLVLLCGGCHRALHLGQLSVRAAGRQQFNFWRGDVLLPAAPPQQGTAVTLRGHPVDPDDVGGRWGGEPLDVGYATDVLRRAWNPERPAA